MELRFDYEPIPVHVPFHQSRAYERALYGAFGSGKTYAICAEAIAVALEQPGARILVARKTAPELRDTVEPIFMEMLPTDLFHACDMRRMGGHYERVVFPNGSTVLFRSIDDWQKHKSLNVAWIFYDEADEIDEESYMGMASRVRQRDPTAEAKRQGAGEITRRGIVLACNPAGHNWIWRRFVNPKTRMPETEYFKSTSLDNPYLSVEYVESLLRYPDPWVKRYVLCNFDDFGGQIYEEWAWDTHVVKPFKGFDPGAAFWMGFDPGTRSANAGLWVVVDQKQRRLIAVAEYEETGLAADVHAKAWRKIESQHKMSVRYRVSDPTITTRDRGSNMSLHAQYRRLGFTFSLGPKGNDVRIPALGQLIHQRRFLVTEDCPQTYETIKNYKWADLTPSQRAKGIEPREAPLKKDDHLPNCAQYLASRWVVPPKQKLHVAEQTFSQECQDIIRKNLTRRRTVHKHELGGLLV